MARIVKRVRRYDHITPALIELHWLPIRSRIQYKVALLTFKTMSTNRPSYLAEMLSVYRPARELRSGQRCQLQVGICRTVFGSRAFRHAAATVWNSLPIELANTSLSHCLHLKNILRLICINNHSVTDNVTTPRLRFDSLTVDI